MRIGILALLTACSDYNLGTEPEVLPGSPLMVEGSRWWSQRWDLTVDETDILFFGDTSGSMEIELQTLGGQITTFVQDLAAYSTNWQLLAVTGPDGCGVGGVIDADTPDFAAVFSTGMLTPPGADLVDEWGLYNAYQAVLQSAEGGCNEGFLREEANLHVVFISDEDDNSPGYDSGDENYWQTYVDGIQAAKPEDAQVTFSAIAGPWPDGCDGAEPGTGYWHAVDATDGQYLSICEDWVSEMNRLATASVQRRTFPLEHLPEQDSLRVVVNGNSRRWGWRYDADGNAVVFTSDLPSNGDDVWIRYKVVEYADTE